MSSGFRHSRRSKNVRLESYSSLDRPAGPRDGLLPSGPCSTQHQTTPNQAISEGGLREGAASHLHARSPRRGSSCQPGNSGKLCARRRPPPSPAAGAKTAIVLKTRQIKRPTGTRCAFASCRALRGNGPALGTLPGRTCVRSQGCPQREGRSLSQ